MTSNRRDFIVGTGATIAAISGLTACAKREAAVAATDPLAGIADDMLADYPENATSLGIDVGPRAALKARLTDRSAAGQQAIAKRVAARLAGLQKADASAARRRRAHRPRRRAHGARDRRPRVSRFRTATLHS